MIDVKFKYLAHAEAFYESQYAEGIYAVQPRWDSYLERWYVTTIET